MNADDAGEKRPFPNAGFLDDSIVRDARASVGKMLGTAIDALGEDIKTVLKSDAAENTKIQKAVTQITVDLITLLADRVEDILSDPSAMPSSRQTGGDDEDPANSRRPGAPERKDPP